MSFLETILFLSYTYITAIPTYRFPSFVKIHDIIPYLKTGTEFESSLD